MQNVTGKVRLILFVLAVVSVRPARACICGQLGPKTEFKRVDAVFLGKVVAYDGRWATFEVLENFKGANVREIRVRTSEYGESCGYGWALQPNSDHLVFATITKTGDLHTSTCTRTWRREGSECDLRLLRRRAAWWRSKLSSFRILQRLGIHWNSCYPRVVSR